VGINPRKIWLGVLGVACMMAAGCPSACDEVTKLLNPSAGAVKSVTVSPATAQLGIGQTQQFTVDVQPSSVTDKTVTWAVVPSTAGTIDSSGILTARTAGAATVTATSVATTSVAGSSLVTITP
jgi:uncharacterized protein YjdB